MPSSPRPPLVLAEGWDITFYSSEDALNRHVEPWIAQEVDYRAYDSEGRKLELTVALATITRRWLSDTTQERIVVRAVESEPGHADELAKLLARWLPMVGAPNPAPDAPLEQLLQASIERVGLDA